MRNFIGVLISLVYVLLVMFTAKWINNKELRRKYIHILLCHWWIIAMILIDNIYWACVGPIGFTILNFLSYKKNIIPIIERDKKDGLGTVYYALTLLILVILSFGIFNNKEVALISILLMGYGDGLATVIGISIKSKSFDVFGYKKSVARMYNYVFSFLNYIIYIFCICRYVLLDNQSNINKCVFNYCRNDIC